MKTPRPLSSPRAAPAEPLKPASFLILVCLATGDRHGYALRREVSARSDGAVRLGPASLYRTIATLLDGRLIEESERRIFGPRPEEERGASIPLR